MHTIYIDGGTNGIINEACFIVENENGDQLKRDHQTYAGKRTNNQLEYTALINAISWAIDNLTPRDRVRIKTDSALITNQVNHLWRTKDFDLKKANATFQGLRAIFNKGIDKVTVMWIPRKMNKAGTYLEQIQKQRKINKDKLARYRDE